MPPHSSKPPADPDRLIEIGDGAGFVEDVSGFSYRDVAIEDWAALVILWVMGIIVFIQFFTRYALNSSEAWTEEVAVYMLMALTFIGSCLAVRRNSHIHIEFFFQYMGPRVARVVSTAVDLFRVFCFAFLTWLGAQVSQLMTHQNMIYFDDTPISIVYWICTAGCALLTLRAVQVAVRHWRQGHSALTRPGGGLGEIG